MRCGPDPPTPRPSRSTSAGNWTIAAAAIRSSVTAWWRGRWVLCDGCGQSGPPVSHPRSPACTIAVRQNRTGWDATWRREARDCCAPDPARSSAPPAISPPSLSAGWLAADRISCLAPRPRGWAKCLACTHGCALLSRGLSFAVLVAQVDRLEPFRSAGPAELPGAQDGLGFSPASPIGRGKPAWLANPESSPLPMGKPRIQVGRSRQGGRSLPVWTIRLPPCLGFSTAALVRSVGGVLPSCWWNWRGHQLPPLTGPYAAKILAIHSRSRWTTTTN